jgi:hypothetical protein
MASRTSKCSTFKTLSSSKRESKASDSWPYWSYVLSLSRSHIGLHALILLPKPYTSRIWVYTWLVILSHAVLRVVQVFHPLWCWVWLVSLWECFGLPSVEMWVDRVRIDVVVWAMVGMVEMVNTAVACGAWICEGLNLRSRHPRTTCVATCPVWNDLVTNYYR